MAISANLVKELREKSGAGIMDCKKALEEAEGDIQKALIFLREQGITQAAKKVGRVTKEGIIYATISSNLKNGAMIELNCETDFVARTSEFRNLVKQMAVEVMALDASISSDGQFPVSEFLKRPASLAKGEAIGDLLTKGIARLGENLGLKRFVRFTQNHGLILSYIHPGEKLGVLLDLNCEPPTSTEKEAVHILAKDIAMQIAAANPLVIGRDELRPEDIERERNIYRTQAINERKPEKVIDRIADGKLEKYYQEVCLLEQPFIKDQDRMVRDVIAATQARADAKLTVKRFARFRLGE